MSEGQKKAQNVSVDSIKPTEPVPMTSRAMSYFDETQHELERMFDSFFSRFRPSHRAWALPSFTNQPFDGRTPRIDLVDRDDEILIKAELPGVEKKDLDVSVTDNTVTIKATTRSESKEEKGDYYRQELSSGYFSRSIALPCAVDGKTANAKLKDGVLELTLGKIEKSKRQRIEVK